MGKVPENFLDYAEMVEFAKGGVKTAKRLSHGRIWKEAHSAARVLLVDDEPHLYIYDMKYATLTKANVLTLWFTSPKWVASLMLNRVFALETSRVGTGQYTIRRPGPLESPSYPAYQAVDYDAQRRAYVEWWHAYHAARRLDPVYYPGIQFDAKTGELLSEKRPITRRKVVVIDKDKDREWKSALRKTKRGVRVLLRLDNAKPEKAVFHGGNWPTAADEVAWVLNGNIKELHAYVLQAARGYSWKYSKAEDLPVKHLDETLEQVINSIRLYARTSMGAVEVRRVAIS